jgi:hypothetical protein
MNKTPYVHTHCQDCNKKFSTIDTYEYDWSEKKTITNHIQNAKSNWSGQEVINIDSSKYNPHYAHQYKNAKDKFFVSYRNKFKGLLVDGNSSVGVYFSSISCQDCLKANLANKDSFEYKLNKLLIKKSEEGFDSIKPYQRYSTNRFQLFRSKSEPAFDNLGCITFGFSTIYGWKKEELEKDVEHLMTNVLKVKFDFVYTYSERLNPDRDGVYCIIRPLHFLNEKPKKAKPIKKESKTPGKSLVKATLKNIEVSSNSNWVHPKNCFGHMVLSCYGGLHRETYENFHYAARTGRLTFVGYETPMPDPESKEFLYSKDFFLASFIDEDKQEKYYAEGYLTEESSKEFYERLNQYMVVALEIFKTKRVGEDKIYNVFSIVSSYIGLELVRDDVKEFMAKIPAEEKLAIQKKRQEFKEYESRVFSRY